MFPGISTGGGGFQGSSSAESGVRSSDQNNQRKVFNIGSQGTSTISMVALAGAAVFITFLIIRK